MGRDFFDTSALVKLYHPEPGTRFITGLVADRGNEFFISSLALVEMQSALAQNLRAGVLSQAQYQLARGRFGADVRAGRPQVEDLLPAHQQIAEKLIVLYAPSMRFRTLDALQLAVAKELHFANRIDQFLVADEHLARVAQLESLSIVNPLSS